MGQLWGPERAPSLALTARYRVDVMNHLHPEPDRMFRLALHRTWRLAVTVGPLAAIALSLAAGLKWR